MTTTTPTPTRSWWWTLFNLDGQSAKLFGADAAKNLGLKSALTSASAEMAKEFCNFGARGLGGGLSLLGVAFVAATTLFVLRDIVINHPAHEDAFLTYIIVGTLLIVFLAMLFILIAGVLVFLSSNKTTTAPPPQTDAHTEPRDEVVPVPAT
eukprot:CAMPEP_0198645512 /NCGR_PEP_ID=MMETSP1467-20131203/1289_1 /TAXON_ID=1462469 /ORGANISM="unid. sp., Strain CCMP2135" /LENGTH=151 /DNA_ID=CAMNT_0044381003 /DNA_START=31 /DNA_END=486 /DNA_ORIENTATION=+